MRVRLDISYDGTAFHGWAKQPGLRTVQGELETAIATVSRLDTAPSLTCAGRTDTGVHARGQVAHLDLADAANELLHQRLRRILPEDLVVRSCAPAPEEFDARFAAVQRRYIYRIDDSGAPDPLLRSHVVSWTRPLDVPAMNVAGQQLLGDHDFAAFCKQRAGATSRRTLLELSTERKGSLVQITVRADAFCHSMVRALTGALVAVGEHRYDPSWVVEVLNERARDPRVRVMPAHGLTLEEVTYPPDHELAARVITARRRRDEPDWSTP